MSSSSNDTSRPAGRSDPESIAAELRTRVHQQEVIADLGIYALSGAELQSLMDHAVRQVATVLEVDYCKVLELLPSGDALLLRAGVGWQDGLVGKGTVGIDRDSQAGFTLRSKEPVIVEDLRTEKRFRGPPLLVEHQVVSGMSVIIHGPERPYGVLGTHSRRRREFTRDDVHFIQAIANILGEAVERRRSEEAVEEARHQLEKRVEERTAELRALNSELESFAYSVSHDLRAPLRSIEGFSRAILEDQPVGLSESSYDYLRRIRSAAMKMNQLIDDILRLSQVSLSDIAVTEVDLTELANAVVTELRERYPEQEVEVAIDDDMRAHGDERLLGIVLANLLSNAWKFTRRQEKRQVEVRRTRRGRQDVFVVRDNGAGFDMKLANNLFTPFRRLHAADEFEGSGIGLATVKRIIHMHHGRVWAESKEGQGASFYFELAAS